MFMKKDFFFFTETIFMFGKLLFFMRYDKINYAREKNTAKDSKEEHGKRLWTINKQNICVSYHL